MGARAGLARNAMVVPCRAARRGDVGLPRPEIAIEGLDVVVAGRADADHARDLPRRFDEEAEKVPVAQVEPVVAQRCHGQHSVRARELHGPIEQDKIRVVANRVPLRVDVVVAALRDVAAQTHRGDVEMLEA